MLVVAQVKLAVPAILAVGGVLIAKSVPLLAVVTAGVLAKILIR